MKHGITFGRRGLAVNGDPSPAELAQIEKGKAAIKAEMVERERPKSDVPGVYFNKKSGKWDVILSVYGKVKSFGSFHKKEEAEAKAREVRRLNSKRVKAAVAAEILASPPTSPTPPSGSSSSASWPSLTPRPTPPTIATPRPPSVPASVAVPSPRAEPAPAVVLPARRADPDPEPRNPLDRFELQVKAARQVSAVLRPLTVASARSVLRMLLTALDGAEN